MALRSPGSKSKLQVRPPSRRNFWNTQLWDTETLAAFAQAIRNIAPVEDVLVEGELLKGAEATPKVRVCGMRHADRMVVLVADYDLTEPKALELRLPVRAASDVTDLDTGEKLGTVSETQPGLRLTIGPARGRLLLVQPPE